ncbi:Phage Gp37Gp68, partial [mine drainage metagenome]
EEYNRAFVDDALTGFCAHSAGGWYGERIDWVIVGGESGPNARPMDDEWARSIRDQCVHADVPFFFKQWGGRDRHRGHEEAVLDGQLWKQMPSISILTT